MRQKPAATLVLKRPHPLCCRMVAEVETGRILQQQYARRQSHLTECGSNFIRQKRSMCHALVTPKSGRWLSSPPDSCSVRECSSSAQRSSLLQSLPCAVPVACPATYAPPFQFDNHIDNHIDNHTER